MKGKAQRLKHQADLEGFFRKVRRNHLEAERQTTSRAVLGSSVIRVFAEKTKPEVRDALVEISMDELRKIKSRDAFESWYEARLTRLARIIRRRNQKRTQVGAGYKWGHAAKILNLYLRDMVSYTNWFNRRERKRICPWLYLPVDRIVMARLEGLGYPLEFSAIKEIDTFRKFRIVQDLLLGPAERTGVPRVWFDDVWGSRSDL